eukprot:CFRG4280T1
MHMIAPQENFILSQLHKVDETMVNVDHINIQASSPPRCAKQFKRNISISFAGSALNDLQFTSNSDNKMDMTELRSTFSPPSLRRLDESLSYTRNKHDSSTTLTSNLDDMNLNTTQLYAMDPENVYAGLLVKNGKGHVEHWTVHTPATEYTSVTFEKCESCLSSTQACVSCRDSIVGKTPTLIPVDLVTHRSIHTQQLITITKWDSIRVSSLRKHSETVAGIIL